MATHQISVMNGLSPVSEGCFWEPFDIKATNDVWKFPVLIFNDTGTRIGAHGTFRIPKSFVGSPKIYFVWTTTATSGNAVWDFDYRAIGGDDAESLDQSGTQEALTVTDAAPGAALRRLQASVNLAAANLAIDDTVEFAVFRDGADAADTLSAALILVDVVFEWADA